MPPSVSIFLFFFFVFLFFIALRVSSTPSKSQIFDNELYEQRVFDTTVFIALRQLMRCFNRALVMLVPRLLILEVTTWHKLIQATPTKQALRTP